MAVQYSLSYDAQGNPSLVKNTITGSAPVIKTDNFEVGKFTPKRTVQTDFDFTDSFNTKEQYKILNDYIKDNDADTDVNESEMQMYDAQGFEAEAARDEKGKIIGGLTATEKLKMSAVETYIQSKLNPIQSALIGMIPFVGSVHKATVFAGSKFVDPYYDPVDDDYYMSGFGMYDDSSKAIESRKDRIEEAGGVDIDGTMVHGAEGGFEDTSPKPEAPKPTPPNPYHGGQGGVQNFDNKPKDTKPSAPPSQGFGNPNRDGRDNGGGGGGSPGSEGPGGSNEMGSF